MTAFLIDRVVFLVTLALHEVEIGVTKSLRRNRVVSFIRDLDAEISVCFLGIIKRHRKRVESSVPSTAVGFGVRERIRGLPAHKLQLFLDRIDLILDLNGHLF